MNSPIWGVSFWEISELWPLWLLILAGPLLTTNHKRSHILPHIMCFSLLFNFLLLYLKKHWLILCLGPEKMAYFWLIRKSSGSFCSLEDSLSWFYDTRVMSMRNLQAFRGLSLKRLSHFHACNNKMIQNGIFWNTKYLLGMKEEKKYWIFPEKAHQKIT